jgi:hypothetical protein
MSDQPEAVERQKLPIEIKDLYRTLLDTRNLEISLFWQRSNYFLVLNSGIAFGFFNSMKPRFAIIFAVIGFVASVLWFWVCLGSKFWQARWEHRLFEFEREHMPNLAFFSASQERIESDARGGLSFHKDMSWAQRLVYRLALRRPSVTYAMIRLSIVFVLSWLLFLVALAVGKNPLS